MVVRIHQGQSGLRPSETVRFLLRRSSLIFSGSNGRPVSTGSRLQASLGNGESAARRRDREADRRRRLQVDGDALFRWRDLRPARREHPRAGRFHCPADEPAGGECARAAAPDRCSSAGLGGPDHLRDAVLRLLAAGSQGSAAGGDRGQAHGEHDRGRRRGPGTGDRFPPAPAPGVLRCAGGPPVRGAGVRLALSQEEPARSATSPTARSSSASTGTRAVGTSSSSSRRRRPRPITWSSCS